MRLVKRDELIKLPRGTIFREFEPLVWASDWQRIEEPCGDNDIFVSTVGAHIAVKGYDADRPFAHFTIDSVAGREALYGNENWYLILEQADINAIIRQFQGEQVEDVENVYMNIDEVIGDG
jgi:hypothetical protein